MWTLEKINQFIEDGIEENINLDYKGAGSIEKTKSKKTEISKDVSAFANSDGGTIIYGVREFNEVDKRHLPEKLDPIDGQEYSKEWLEQIINSTISPRVKGIKITPIQVFKKENNQVIYVVEIPKSNTAHQMNDKRYYRRYNFESIQMDDWEIKDVINRQTTSNIIIRLAKKDSTPWELIRDMISKKTFVNVRYDIIAHNQGNKMAQVLDVFISGNTETVKYVKHARLDTAGRFELYFSNEEERKVKIGDTEFVINVNRIPLTPSTFRVIGEITINSSLVEANDELTLQVCTEDYSKMSVINKDDIIE